MTRRKLPPSTTAVLILLLPVALGGAGAALAQGTSTQVSPLATDQIPAQGPGQAPIGAAVTGSAPGPGAPGTPSPGPVAPSPIDQSQEQGGVLLKPGPRAGDMGAASGAENPAPKPSPQ